ncbi:reverse transcriptase domain-containing protein [Tanacetum coccineum]
MWAADRVVASTPGSAITIPETTNEFAIKDNHLTLVKGNQFDGRTKTDPHKHIYEFLGIYDMFKYIDTKNEVVRLMMFPLSLIGEAKTWLNELNEGTIEMWDEQPTSDLNDDDIPMSRKEEAKFMQTFHKTPDLGASINLMTYSLYAKLSLETLKPTKMSIRLADRSFQYPVGIAENMLVEVVIRVKLEVGTEWMIFNIDSAMQHSYSNDDTCFSMDVIDEILEEDFDALLDEGSKILHFIKGTLLEEEIFL